MKKVCFENIYQNKKILITGNTGFKGSWLSIWLHHLGAKVFGASVDIPTTPSLYEIAVKDKIYQHEFIDIRKLDIISQYINDIQPDFVFHLAAQALVKNSFENPVYTLETNAIGTMNILESLRKINKKCTAVFITSDKAYDNVEWLWGYRETDALGGKDPYSASKGAAELVIKTYCSSFFNRTDSKVKVGVARAGNVIGGGDWAKDRIVPDAIRAWSVNKVVEIRNPQATRPWQHVLEPLSGYLLLGQKLFQEPELNGQPFNFGPNANQNFSVRELLERMNTIWKEGKWIENSDNDYSKQESQLLKLNCDKALHMLNWQAILDFKQTIDFTVSWYQNYYQNKNSVWDFSVNQIEKYIAAAIEKEQVWVKKENK